MKDIKKLINSSICLMPWINISTIPNGNYRLCCLSSNFLFEISKNKYLNVKNSTIEEVRNSKSIKNYRKLFLNNKKIKECYSCMDLERHGHNSKRIQLIESFYKYTKDIFKYTQSDGTIDTKQFPVLFYDLRLGNLCNAKCITCGNYNSSMFGTSLDWPNKYTSLINYVKENAQYIKRLYFTGGEPLINKYHWDLIDFLISKNIAKKIYIRYSNLLSFYFSK